MPAKASWLLNISEIVSQLETFDAPVVDRAIIERLFGLRQIDSVVHRVASLLAAGIPLGRLDGDMPEQKLDLLQFSSGQMTQAPRLHWRS